MGATNQIKDVSLVEFVLRKRHVWLLPTGLDFGAKTKKKAAMNVFEEEAKPQKNQQKDNSSESEKVPESKREVRCIMRQVKSAKDRDRSQAISRMCRVRSAVFEHSEIVQER